MHYAVKPKTLVKAIVEIKSKDMPRKTYLQYAEKEIAEDDLIGKFKFEC